MGLGCLRFRWKIGYCAVWLTAGWLANKVGIWLPWGKWFVGEATFGPGAADLILSSVLNA